jgi:XTP/dITP diphosphohydrolase
LKTLLIATRNAHKVAEIQGLLGPAFECLSLRDFPTVPAVIEDAPTFAGNATKKATALARWLGENRTEEFGARNGTPLVLADDSGLEVEALNGAPGVNSARFAAQDSGGTGNASDADNNAKLLRLLANVPRERRSARFRCCLALTPALTAAASNQSPVCAADEWELATVLCEGACEGRIEFSPAGVHGFGYDPLFVPTGYTQSFAELGADVKNRISHRALALAKLRVYLDRLAT